MECKGIWKSQPTKRLISVLIETLWNVKITHAYAIENGAFVLIETLWNVKTYTQSDKDIKAFVLIETLWNVKIKQEMQPCSGVSY